MAVVDPETGEERELAKFDEHDRLVNLKEAIGEMVVRSGTGGFEGYYANEEANRERTRNGWYWTGDLGYRDADGFFYFAGRPADWLRVDGENFAAAPVERILSRYPGDSRWPFIPYRTRRPGTRSWPHGAGWLDSHVGPQRLQPLPRGTARPRDQMGSQVREDRARPADQYVQSEQGTPESAALGDGRSRVVEAAGVIDVPPPRDIRYRRR